MLKNHQSRVLAKDFGFLWNKTPFAGSFKRQLCLEKHFFGREKSNIEKGSKVKEFQRSIFITKIRCQYDAQSNMLLLRISATCSWCVCIPNTSNNHTFTYLRHFQKWRWDFILKKHTNSRTFFSLRHVYS